MSVLADYEILQRCEAGMITPYVTKAIKEEGGRKLISYGVSAYGYDIRVANEFRYIRQPCRGIVDPKTDNAYFDTTVADEYMLISPNSMVLCRSVEYFRIPRDIMCVATGKSTYARCGIVANITPLEAEWEGYLTIALSNTSPLPVKIYANEGIAQLIFYKAEQVCDMSYKDKDGKYQGQQGITGAKV